MRQPIKISVLLHKSTHQTLLFWPKIISEKFPSFPEKLTLCAKFGQKWLCWDFKVLPPDYVTINQNSVQFHEPTYSLLPLWPKGISGQFPSFPGKLTLCPKFGQKWLFRDFEVLPPDYVKVNQNFSPIPQIYTPNTTILITKNFWKISQFRRKTYIVCQIGTRIANR